MRFGRGNCGPIPSLTCGRGPPLFARLKTGAATVAAAPVASVAFLTPDGRGETAAAASPGGNAATEGAFSEDLIGSGSLTLPLLQSSKAADAWVLSLLQRVQAPQQAAVQQVAAVGTTVPERLAADKFAQSGM